MTTLKKARTDILERLAKEHRQGRAGVSAGAELAHWCTGVLSGLFRDAAGENPSGLALMVTGSMGRGVMAPGSDLDCVLLEDGRHPDAAKVMEAILYPLWDAGFKVGHALRGVDEFVALCADDEESLTAALDIRFVAGDTALHGALRKSMEERWAIFRAYAKRAARHGLTPGRATLYRLQPDIKNDPGGLRDLHRFWWVAKVLSAEGVEPLSLLGTEDVWEVLDGVPWIEAMEWQALQHAAESLWDLRWALAAVAGPRHGTLRFEWQEEVADYLLARDPHAFDHTAGLADDFHEFLGDAVGASNADRLLGHHYRCARRMRHACSRVFERVFVQHWSQAPQAQTSADGSALGGLHAKGSTTTGKNVDLSPFAQVNGRVEFCHGQIDDGCSLEEGWALLRASQIWRLPVGSKAQARLHAAAELGWEGAADPGPKVAALFMDLLAHPWEAARQENTTAQDHGDAFLGEAFLGGALELAHALGLLVHVLPEIRPLTGLVQRDLYHTYTVDAHLLYCTRQAMAVLAGVDPEAPLEVREIARRLPRPRILVLAALLHDIGKGSGKDHSLYGAELSQTIGERLRLPKEDIEDLRFLVAEHLLLFRTSQRRDLEDVDLIDRLSEKVANQERLELLWALSYVDAKTTGATVWNDWRRRLLAELCRKIVLRLQRGEALPSLAEQAKAKADIMRQGPLEAKPQMEAWLEKLPDRHVVAHAPEFLESLLAARREAEESGKPVVFCRPDGLRGCWTCALTGPDRPGLLADLTGVLAAHGIAILSALLATGSDGMVLDTFDVSDSASRLFEDDARRAALMEELTAAFARAPAFEKALDERRSAQPRPPVRPTTKVTVDRAASTQATVVDIVTDDRVGLLHSIAKAVFAVGALIESARIGTDGARCVDSLYLRAVDGGGPLGPDLEAKTIDMIQTACMDAWDD